jgi:hypothetical protein
MRKIYLIFITISLMNLPVFIQAQAPGCTVNISPANAMTNVNPYPFVTLRWTPVAGATSYEVYISSKTPPKQLASIVSSDTLDIDNLAYSTVYYWYVIPKNENGAAINCTSNITSFTTSPQPPPPSNDDCNGALTISPTPTSGTTLGATLSRPASNCGGYTGTANDDVWYEFTAKSDGLVTISMTGTGSFDGVLETFSGACGALNSLACSDSSQAGGREQIALNVTTGTTYKIRVYGFYAALADRGNFTISATGSPLPIALLNFKGERRANKNNLSWATAAEQNNKGFELQYSNEGNNFDKLSFVNSKSANGTSSSILSYEYTDARSLSGNAYYRLKQIDKDGHSNFSNIIFLKGDKIDAISLSNIYPNPAKNKLNITIAAPANDKVKIEIRDVAGKLVMQQSSTIINGDNNLTVDVTSLPSGSYFIKAISNNGNQTNVNKFVKE